MEGGIEIELVREFIVLFDVFFFRFLRLLDFCRFEVLKIEIMIIRINSKLILVFVFK